MKYTADFETTTIETDCRVWAYGLYEIEKGIFTYGNNIHDFFSELELRSQKQINHIYMHNLKFDGAFIIDYLLKNNYEWVEERKELDTKTFTTLITDNKIFYSIEVCFERKGKKTVKTIFYDSLKILPFSVDTIAKGFNLPIEKLSIDYHQNRPKNHELTIEEIMYLRNDVEIIGLALKEIFSQNLKKMTAGSNALHDFKSIQKNFKKYFPVLDYDHELRESYKGGFTYVNDKYKNKIVGPGIVLDVNSLYPSIMRNKLLPYGEGKLFKGEYIKDPIYPLYIQMIRCQFELKKDHIPTIQIKGNIRYQPNEYLSNSGDEGIVLTLTSVDLDLMKKHYNIYNLEYISGFKFKATIGLFTEYIDKWSEIKINAKINNNGALYTLAKLMLNSLYGKFATNPKVRGSKPFLNNDAVAYQILEEKEIKSVYLPVATFITSYGRDITIDGAQKNYDRFIYADTDSLHMMGLDPPDNLEISSTELGKWDHEYSFIKAKYLRQKAYMQTDHNNKTKVVISGMPSSIHKNVNYNNFNINSSFTIEKIPFTKSIIIDKNSAKLRPKTVPGGVVLIPTHFTLRD